MLFLLGCQSKSEKRLHSESKFKLTEDNISAYISGWWSVDYLNNMDYLCKIKFYDSLSFIEWDEYPNNKAQKDTSILIIESCQPARELLFTDSLVFLISVGLVGTDTAKIETIDQKCFKVGDAVYSKLFENY